MLDKHVAGALLPPPALCTRASNQVEDLLHMRNGGTGKDDGADSVHLTAPS